MAHTSLTTDEIKALSDSALMARLTHLANRLRFHTVEIITLLAEVESRAVHLRDGCPSLFIYCTQVLRFSEHEAYHRIQAARASRRFPSLLVQLQAGNLSLTVITLLAPHLTVENYDSVVDRARGRTKREVEEIVAALAPKQDTATLVKRLPVSDVTSPTNSIGPSQERADLLTTPASSSTNPADACQPRLAPESPSPSGAGNSRFAVLEGPVVGGGARSNPQPRVVLVPLSAERYLLRVTISAQTHTKLRYAQNLSRHSIPGGDIATILDRALTLFVHDLERVKLGRVDRPRVSAHARPDRRSRVRAKGRTRRIPSEVRRAVWVRDDGRCTFVGPEGRCRAVEWLEFHHILPFAAGWPPTAENITLRCRAHNQYEADEYFGAEKSDQAAS